ncbi:TRAFAC clade GTPase domain-containing protein [Janthinobacterium sp. Mn2066]|uniref:TRAFAC clade GTPase domain-containing protein n=1 Tax=Janthinobacterium sp. Mn2066 TaxID=3395264 RepID=UPI003BD553DA
MKSYPPEACPSHLATIARVKGGDFETQNFGIAVDESSSTPSEQSSGISGDAVLQAPEVKPSLPRSGTMGLHETNLFMSQRYVNMVGIVGLPNAGKTACITSLYLLLAHSAMSGFRYLDSKTLMAFEEIARGSRRWNDGSAPKQMTSHTELADDRQAGFLHLRMKRDADGRKFDLLLPDLPGEWSRTLISAGDSARFEFLRSAEAIWLMVNGADFLQPGTREVAIHRMTNLIERLAALLLGARPRTILVATWRDKGDFPNSGLQRIQEYGKTFGMTIEFASIASFSDTEVQPGAGIADLIDKTLNSSAERPNPWPVETGPDLHREFLKYGIVQ